MAVTSGMNHLGLAVADLKQTTDFFVNLLGWEEVGYDATYPRTAVTDSKVRLTLWQIDRSLNTESFDRRKNIGLHHLALEIETEQQLNELCEQVKDYAGVEIEFEPELVGQGPRKHMMCYEPGGIRVEFIWHGK